MAGVTRNGLLFENTNTTQQLPVGVAHPLPVQIFSGTSTSPTTLKLYEKEITTITTWTPLTLTTETKGLTIDIRANTSTATPPDFDFAFTSTGSPFNRVLSRGSYWDDGLRLATNSVLYFRIGSMTSSVIQVVGKNA